MHDEIFILEKIWVVTDLILEPTPEVDLESYPTTEVKHQHLLSDFTTNRNDLILL
jgi:hypothetical protein